MKKILIVSSEINILTTALDSNDINENLLSEPISYRLSRLQNLESLNPIKSQLDNLPQKIKHRKKINYHN